VLRIPIKHLVGIGVLTAMAFGLRFWLQTDVGFDISIRDTYWAIPLRAIAFWCLIGTAFIWFLVVGWTSVRRRS